jgi:hypothetical protein
MSDCSVDERPDQKKPERSFSVLVVPSLQIDLPRRLRTAVIPAALGLALLTAKSEAFEQSATPLFMPESYTESLQYYVQGLRDSQGLQVETKSESSAKFAARFSAVETVKESKKIGFGLLSVTTSYANSRTLFGPGPATETRQDQTIALDLTNLQKGNGEAFPSVIWALSPSAVYVNSFVKETPHQTVVEDPPLRATGFSAGASWGWNQANAGVNYWNYSLDTNVGGQPYNSTGRGADASIGTYAGSIGFYAGLSYHDTEELTVFSRAVDRGYDAYLSASYKPQYLPDIAIDGSFGRYEYNSLWFGTDATYWSTTFGFDFSKFLWSPVDKSKLSAKAPSAKLFYRYYSQTEHSVVGAAPANSQLVGLMFRTGL